MAHNRLTTAARRGIWVLAASGAAFGLAACGDTETADDAVQRAALEINTLSLGGTNPLPDENIRLTAYRQIVTDLQPHSTGGSPATAAAANMLVARAHSGLATIQVGDVVEAEGKSHALIDLVRIQLDRYTGQQVQVLSLGGYDPTAHLADLDSQITAKDAEIAKAWSEKAALDGVLEGIEGRAAAASAQAKQQRERETALRQQAINATTVEQAELITKANEHKRAADGHDKEASLLRAQAAQQAPEGVVFQSEIDRLTDQRKLLEEAKVEINAFAKSNSDRAAAARADAMGAAELIRQRAGELAALRAEIPALAEKAAQSYDAAIRAAKTAQAGGGDARAQAAVTIASNQHAKADLLTMRSRGLAAYAAILTALAEATPALPDAQAYRTKGADATAEAEKLAAEAKALIEEAAGAYENAGGGGDTSERFKKLAAALGKPGEMPAAQASAGASNTATVAPAGDVEGEIRAMLEEVIAIGVEQDLSKIIPMMHFTTPEAKALIESLASIDSACHEKLGQSFTQVAAQATGGMGGPMGQSIPTDTFGDSVSSVDDLDIAIASPTSATVAPRDGSAPQPTVLVKLDGQWKIQVDLPIADAAMMGEMAKIFEALAGDIRSGAIASADQFGPAMMQRMMPLMMRMQQQGGG